MGSHPETKESQKAVDCWEKETQTLPSMSVLIGCSMQTDQTWTYMHIITKTRLSRLSICVSVCIVYIVRVHVYPHMYTHMHRVYVKIIIKRKLSAWEWGGIEGFEGRVAARGWKEEWKGENASVLFHLKIFLKKKKNNSQVFSYSRFRSNAINQIVYFS